MLKTLTPVRLEFARLPSVCTIVITRDKWTNTSRERLQRTKSGEFGTLSGLTENKWLAKTQILRQSSSEIYRMND